MKPLLFKEKGFFESAQDVVSLVRNKMRKYDYNGPAGIDFYIFRDHTNSLHLKVFGEINPRTTMAHISNGLRKYLSSNIPTHWLLNNARALKESKFNSWSDFYEVVKQEQPLIIEKSKWVGGIVFTNDPYLDNRSQSILAIGEEAINYINTKI